MDTIKNIEIKNFKSIQHLKIDGCKRINVFIGYPNVGKSNILEAVGTFSTFLLGVGEDDFKFNEIIRAKRFSELFFNKNYRNSARVLINNRISLELEINQSNDLELTGFDVSRNLKIFASTVNSHDFNSRISVPLSDQRLNGILAPIRKYEFKNDILINRQRPFSLSIPFGYNLLDILHRDSDLRKEIAGLLDEYNQRLIVDDEEIIFLKYLNDDTGVSIPYHLVADTLKRLIFYKAAVKSNKGSVLLFEEPEAHMFPPYIRKFTSDVIFDKTNQFFIATHSPYVLDAFTEEIPEELAIYLVYYEKGETKVRQMSGKDMDEVRQYGVDLFYNLESYLKHGQVNNA